MLVDKEQRKSCCQFSSDVPPPPSPTVANNYNLQDMKRVMAIKMCQCYTMYTIISVSYINIGNITLYVSHQHPYFTSFIIMLHSLLKKTKQLLFILESTFFKLQHEALN